MKNESALWRNQHLGRGLRVPKRVPIIDLATGHITLDILKADVAHNGATQMLVDVAEAQKNGVKLTTEAQEYVRDVITRQRENISATGYPMRDTDW